jgi:biopolymer transport protein ExbD
MQAVKLARVQSSINVTPLVDVVLVLLIIFMIIAPQLQWGPPVQLPTTDQPPKKPDDGRQIVVAMETDGFVWIEGDRFSAQEFPERLRIAAEERPDWQVVIKGDARLTFGEVERAMLAVEAAGFKNVGLIAERREDAEEGS